MIYLGDQQVGLNGPQDRGAILYTEEQELTEAQKERARNNIGVVDNDESAVVTDVKNRINTIIGERTIKWEPGYIATTRNQAVDYANITGVNQYVHCVVDVTPGDVLHITAKYEGAVVFATVSSADVQIGDSGTASFTDKAYTIPSNVAKIIANSPINYPYDVYFDTTTLTSINEAIANLSSKTVQTHGQITAGFISDGEYSNLIDLPYNRVYAVPGAISINGKPSGFQNAPFTFLAVAPNSGTSVAYRVYFAIGKDETYYGFGYQGDTTISWKRADTGDKNIMYLKNRINSILGDLSVTWEPGRIVSSNNQTVDYTNVADTDRCVHCVVDVTPGKVVHITGTYCKSPIFCTVNASGVQNRASPGTETYNNLTYTIPSDTVKLIINALAANPYDVWVETDSISTLKNSINTLSNTVDIMAKKPFDTINHNKIVLLGDSITQGVGSSDYSTTGEALNTSVYPTQRNVGVKCWGSRIVSLLNDEYGCTAVNNGVSQFGMSDLQNNLDVLLSNDTDYAIVMIGTNNRGTTKANCKTMFESLMNAIMAKGVQPFVFSPIPMNTGTSSLGMGNMQKIFENVCREKGIPFFPLFTNFNVYVSEHGLELSSCYADWGHPNDKGHEIIFNYVRKCLGI